MKRGNSPRGDPVYGLKPHHPAQNHEAVEPHQWPELDDMCAQIRLSQAATLATVTHDHFDDAVLGVPAKWANPAETKWIHHR
eukprot:scaffold139420_cov33-Tisochrysis_lutea.AAC.1